MVTFKFSGVIGGRNDMFFGEDLFYNFLVVLNSKYEEFWPVLW